MSQSEKEEYVLALDVANVMALMLKHSTSNAKIRKHFQGIIDHNRKLIGRLSK